ncbi:MAG: hypothetical protein WC908_01420 [Candidatus Paceibacterota bacterium]
MNKKNNLTIVAVIVIILAVIIIIVLKNGNQKIEPQPLSQSDIELNQAVKSDTTKSITDNINSINVEDTTSVDLVPVDQELQKL